MPENLKVTLTNKRPRVFAFGVIGGSVLLRPNATETFELPKTKGVLRALERRIQRGDVEAVIDGERVLAKPVPPKKPAKSDKAFEGIFVSDADSYQSELEKL